MSYLKKCAAARQYQNNLMISIGLGFSSYPCICFAGVTDVASLRDQQQTRMGNALPQRRGYSMMNGVNC